MPMFKMEDYPDLPEDTLLRCEITKAELTKGRAFGDEEPREQVAVTFEVVEGEFTGATMRRWVNAILSPKSTLAKIATAAFADDKLTEFDTDDLVGRQLIVVGDHGEDGHLTFLRPRRFRAVGKAATNGRSRPAGGSRTVEPEPAGARPTAERDPAVEAAVDF